MVFSSSAAGNKYEQALSSHLKSLRQPLIEGLKGILSELPPEIHALWFLAYPDSMGESGFPVYMQGETRPDLVLPENFDSVPLLSGIPAPTLPAFTDPSFEDSDELFPESDRIVLKLIGTMMWEAWVEAGGVKLPVHAAFGDEYLNVEINLRTGEWVSDL